MIIPDIINSNTIDSRPTIADTFDNESSQKAYYRIGMGDLLDMQKAKDNTIVNNSNVKVHSSSLFSKDNFIGLFDWLESVDDGFQWLDNLLTGKLFVPSKIVYNEYI